MSQPFDAGDVLLYQLESGYGLLRLLAIEGDGAARVWHIRVYRDLFPDIDSAEQAAASPFSLEVDKPHVALTERAFERTPTAKLGNAALTEEELGELHVWMRSQERRVFDRSLLLLLGMR